MTYSLSSLRKSRNVAVLAAVLLFCISGLAAGWAQTADQPDPPAGGPQQTPEEQAWEARQRQALAKKENEKRLQDLKKDTAQLLQLATELKQYVDKTDENMLSVDVIKKAEAIEKLAHSIKENMKGP